MAVIAVVAALTTINPTSAEAADAPVNLGTAGNFSVLAGSTVTNTGASFLSQNLGVHPGDTAPGFPPGQVAGAIHLADAVALQGKSDLTVAFNDAAGRTPFTNIPSEMGGSTLIPGVYRVGVAQVTGQLTLNAQGDPEAVFIFQVDSALNTASNSSVVFINGASPCNVYWKVGSSATIGTGTAFIGTIMAQESISLATGATLHGRALAQTSAVTLDTNVITEPVCDTSGPTPTPTPTATPTSTPTSTPTATPTPTPTPTDPPPSPTPTGPPPTGTPTPSPPPTSPPPTGTPTPTPTDPPPSPTPTDPPPTETPTPSPTPTSPPPTGTAPPTAPTATPTNTSSPSPTATDTTSPGPAPTDLPSSSPSAAPAPTAGPTPPGSLPVTGSSGTMMLAGAGTALLGLGALLLVLLRRRDAHRI